MTIGEILIALFAVLVIGLMMPFSYAVRMGIFLALLGLVVVTILGGGMHLIASVFD